MKENLIQGEISSTSGWHCVGGVVNNNWPHPACATFQIGGINSVCFLGFLAKYLNHGTNHETGTNIRCIYNKIAFVQYNVLKLISTVIYFIDDRIYLILSEVGFILYNLSPITQCKTEQDNLALVMLLYSSRIDYTIIQLSYLRSLQNTVMRNVTIRPHPRHPRWFVIRHIGLRGSCDL